MRSEFGDHVRINMRICHEYFLFSQARLHKNLTFVWRIIDADERWRRELSLTAKATQSSCLRSSLRSLTRLVSSNLRLPRDVMPDTMGISFGPV
jgi:hypothetical protein